MERIFYNSNEDKIHAFFALFPFIPIPFGGQHIHRRIRRPGLSKGERLFCFGAVIVKNDEDELDCKTHTRRARKKILNSYRFEELKNSKLRDNCRKIVIHEIIKGSYDFAYVLLRKNEVHEHLRKHPGAL